MCANVAHPKVAKIERLMNLVIALLSTRGYLTADRIRANVAGYGNQTDEAFSRMFERDKSELRDLGIPLETGRVSAIDPTEGYRIKPDDYALPAIDLTPDEAAAVAVATTLWESPERITATQSALLKLRAAGVDVDRAEGVAIASAAGPAGLRGSEEVLGILFAAVDTRQAVRFRHRSTPIEPYTVRTVEPWGVLTARGRWYLVGHDCDREATRVFRVSRITDATPLGAQGTVSRPDGVDLRALVEHSIGAAAGRHSGAVARVWVADGHATALRRAGRTVASRAVGGRGGDVIEIDVASLDGLAREIAGYGPVALVLEPDSLRSDVMARLAAQAGTRS
jgi:proteasome accessory factor B